MFTFAQVEKVRLSWFTVMRLLVGTADRFGKAIDGQLGGGAGRQKGRSSMVVVAVGAHLPNCAHAG